MGEKTTLQLYTGISIRQSTFIVGYYYDDDDKFNKIEILTGFKQICCCCCCFLILKTIILILFFNFHSEFFLFVFNILVLFVEEFHFRNWNREKIDRDSYLSNVSGISGYELFWIVFFGQKFFPFIHPCVCVQLSGIVNLNNHLARHIWKKKAKIVSLNTWYLMMMMMC